MTEEQRDRFFDLLTNKAVYGLTEEEQRELDQFDQEMVEMEFRSLEKTAAAISMVGLEVDEPLPTHLFNRIADDAEMHIGRSEAEAPWPPPETIAEDAQADRGTPWTAWLGWAVAAAACVALAVNIFIMRPSTTEVARVEPPPTQTPRIETPAEMRDELLRSGAALIRGDWAPGNVKDIKEITGDVVWSDEKQAGYMRFRGLPANDPEKETYQLWIFDETQDKATPIDGGTFDVSADGEIIIPIDAKLKAQSPELFAVTIEKPGGVVVSKREKIAALAKVETRSS